ncbi:MAG: citrate synthase, partial [Methylobacteriaceae bacterium]|nr:citrate synthase [Methylobacteriaceae bacterium]
PIPATKRALHWHLGWAWGVPGSQDVLRRTLVLLADDDSCAPAVAARAAVSNGTSPAAALLVGLACWTGSFRNGAAARIDDLKTRALERDAAAAVGDYLRRGEPAPGFGHPGFPGGDPRAAALLERFQPNDVFARLLEEGTALTGLRPNMDLTLAALAASLGLPDQAPFVLSVLARSTGWIAHALEQAGLGAVAATE